MTLINPYNFVPFRSSGPDRSKAYPDRFRFKKNLYSGKLVCVLKALRPLITLGKVIDKNYQLIDASGSPKTIGGRLQKIIIYDFLRNANDKAMLQGASIRGMVRTVYEALTDSCMPFAITEGKSKGRGRVWNDYQYKDICGYAHDQCCRLDKLCPTCRLFGKVSGDNLSCQSRVIFSDAILSKGNLHDSSRNFLKELSGPKPHHSPTYGKNANQGGPIAGRKFYYHHSGDPGFWVLEQDSNGRSLAVEAYAPVGAEFTFCMQFENVEKEELKDLILAIELEDRLAHKFGLGKALGLGSCQICIDDGPIYLAANRYQKWKDDSFEDVNSFRKNARKIRPHLREMLRLDKASDSGEIAYPSGAGGHYPNDIIDDFGVFGGSRHIADEVPDDFEDLNIKPEGPPPVVQGEAAPIFLVRICQEKLIFKDLENKCIQTPLNAFQGKQDLLIPGRWYISKGTKAVFPVKK